MRISTHQMHQRAVTLMLEQQARLARTQQQLATGKRFASAAEDPVAAERALRLAREIAAHDQYQANAEAVRIRQTAEETALSDVTELLHEVRELLVQANKGTLNSADRRSLSQSLEVHIDGLLGLANTRDATGEYLFAGLRGDTRPFSSDGRGQFLYHGDEGQRRLGIGPGIMVTMTDSGTELFQRVPAGNGAFVTTVGTANSGNAVISAGVATADWMSGTYSLTFVQAASGQGLGYEVRDGTGATVAQGDYVSGAAIRFKGAEVTVTGSPAVDDQFEIAPAGHGDIFSILDRAARALADPSDDPAARSRLGTELNRGLAELDGALEQVLLARARVGARLEQVDTQSEANEAFRLAATEALSEAQDLDYAEAASRLQVQMLGLEAAQQSYLRIQDLSLFRLLG